MADRVEYGDTDGMLTGSDGAGDQTVPGSSIFQVDVPRAFIFGDAEALAGSAHGGDDTVTSGAFWENHQFGDARTMSGSAGGGNDVLQGSTAVIVLYGDAQEMRDEAQGGDDLLQASGTGAARVGAINKLFGDAFSMGDGTEGGDDTMIGADDYFGDDSMYGDAFEMTGSAQGGDDRLVANSRWSEEMWGDAAVMSAGAEGGRDVFVLLPDKGWDTVPRGSDTIHDFEPGKDRIDLSAFAALGLRDFADLGQRLVEQADATFVVLDAPGGAAFARIVVEGGSGLSEGDFVFG